MAMRLPLADMTAHERLVGTASFISLVPDGPLDGLSAETVLCDAVRE